MMKQRMTRLGRRDFIKYSAAGAASLGCGAFFSCAAAGSRKSNVILIKTDDRAEGVRRAMRLARFNSPKNKKVLIKPNFNTADPTPGSTHNDTLEQIVVEMHERGAKGITVGDRSGPQPTHEVLDELGIHEMAGRLNFDVINFSELPEDDWIPFDPPGNHWENGFSLARPVAESDYIISTCCLKTHQYGGVFTMSLKNWVGTAPKSLMRQLHRSPNMRKMIAELNVPCSPQLIIMDGVEAFVDGGPMTGEKKPVNVVIAGTDRTAIDAVGLAVLKHAGSNDAIMGTRIFEQEQIARAAELGLGAAGPESIKLITEDTAGASYAGEIEAILARG